MDACKRIILACCEHQRRVIVEGQAVLNWMEGQVLCAGWPNEDCLARDPGYVGFSLCLLLMLSFL